MSPRPEPASRPTLLLVEPTGDHLLIRRGVRIDAPERLAPDARRVAAWSAAGIVTGLALVAAHGVVAAGPGLLVLLGW